MEVSYLSLDDPLEDLMQSVVQCALDNPFRLVSVF